MAKDEKNGAVCPHCQQPIRLEMVIEATKEQRFSFVITPQPGSLMSATGVGGVIESVGRLFEADWGVDYKGKCAIHSMSMQEDGSYKIDFVLARFANHQCTDKERLDHE